MTSCAISTAPAMGNAIWAQLWEQWRRTRKYLLWGVPAFSLGLSAFCLLSRWFLLAGLPRPTEALMDLTNKSLMIVLVTGLKLYCISIGLVLTGLPGRVLAGFPSYELRLPVATWVLVACRMAYAFAFSAGAYLAGAAVVSVVTGIPTPFVWAGALFCGTACAGMAMANWSAGGEVRRLIGCLAVVLGLSAWLTWRSMAMNADEPQIAFPPHAGPVFLGSCIVMYAVSVVAVARRRAGEQIDVPSPSDIFGSVFRRLMPTVARYGSPRRALFRFEMQNGALWLPLANGAILLAVLLVSVAVCPFLSARTLDNLALTWAGYASAMFFIAATLAPFGVTGFRNQLDAPRVSAFDMTRPLAVRDLAWAKIAALILSYALTLATTAAAALLWTFLWSDPQVLVENYAWDGMLVAASQALVAGAVLWTGMGFLLSILFLRSVVGPLAFPKRRLAIPLLVVVALLWGTVALLFWLQHRHWWPWIESNVIPFPIGVLSLAACAFALCAAIRRGYLSKTVLSGGVCLWCLFIASVVWMVCRPSPHPPEYPPLAVLFLLGCLLTVPLAPLGTISLAVAAMRHR